jgi:hypothetical protein
MPAKWLFVCIVNFYFWIDQLSLNRMSESLELLEQQYIEAESPEERTGALADYGAALAYSNSHLAWELVDAYLLIARKLAAKQKKNEPSLAKLLRTAGLCQALISIFSTGSEIGRTRGTPATHSVRLSCPEAIMKPRLRFFKKAK